MSPRGEIETASVGGDVNKEVTWPKMVTKRCTNGDSLCFVQPSGVFHEFGNCTKWDWSRNSFRFPEQNGHSEGSPSPKSPILNSEYEQGSRGASTIDRPPDGIRRYPAAARPPACAPR